MKVFYPAACKEMGLLESLDGKQLLLQKLTIRFWIQFLLSPWNPGSSSWSAVSMARSQRDCRYLLDKPRKCNSYTGNLSTSNTF